MKIKQAQSTDEARPHSPRGAGALRPRPLRSVGRSVHLAAARGRGGVLGRGRGADVRCAPPWWRCTCLRGRSTCLGAMHLRVRGGVWPPAGSAVLPLAWALRAGCGRGAGSPGPGAELPATQSAGASAAVSYTHLRAHET